MKEKLQLFKIASDRLKSDSEFCSYYLQNYNNEKLKCSEMEFYKLCLCRIPKDEEKILKIAKYCDIEIEVLSEILKTIIAFGEM